MTTMHDTARGQASALLAQLIGRWSLHRQIDDRRAGSAGRFEGHAEFRPAGDTVRYAETGWLTLPGQAPLRAERAYDWRAEGERIEVRFSDGRHFHSFLAGTDGKARHDCPPDTYDVRYSFPARDRWRSVWDVSGPRKAYRMVSDYRRAP